VKSQTESTLILAQKAAGCHPGPTRYFDDAENYDQMMVFQ